MKLPRLSATFRIGMLMLAVLLGWLVLESSGVGLLKFQAWLDAQRNLGLIPVRLAVYASAIWWISKRAGLTGRALKQFRLNGAALAVLVELVAVQRLFIF